MKPHYYVGIGASAGGLEAIEQFFTNMPPNTGFAFIVIQHLSPDHPSLMNELLAKHTRMPIHKAADGMEVEADTIYLIQPKKNLTIFHGKLLLTAPEGKRGINLPIDIFMKSLAEDQGETSIGVILSGTGSDGTRGVRFIKEKGGMVMVQDENSAKFNGMPKSAIATGLADYILSPTEMANQIISYSRHQPLEIDPEETAVMDDEDGLAAIFSKLRESHGIDFSHYKPSTVLRRIERRLSINQIKNLKDYARFLELYPREISLLFRELLIRVTSFFRDPEVYMALQEKYLAELFNESVQDEIRIWVTACSTGEEAYTIAILCKEVAEHHDIRKKIKIFATDIDDESILLAGAGIYPDSIAADIPENYLAKYFIRRDESHFSVAPVLREMIVFASHNLIKDPPFTNISLVSCRNVLIYFQPVLQQKVLNYFTFSLQNQGLLVLGNSETIGDMNEYFIPLEQHKKIFRSTGKIRSHFTNDRLPLPSARFRERGGASLRHGTFRQGDEERLTQTIMDRLADTFFRAAFVISQQNDLLHVVGNTEGITQLPTGKVTTDFTKMVIPELTIPLVTGLQRVFKKKTEKLTFTDIKCSINDTPLTLNMRIQSLTVTKDITHALVLIEDKGEESKGNEAENTYDISRETKQRILDLEQELQFNRENLQATIEELETSNEELQATNEELLASNEELQSTNEELQSVNEELYTVNAEHQQKIVELTELNTDMDNLLSSTDIATLFLDDSCEIRKFTPKIRDIFSIKDSDIGRPIFHLTNKIRKIQLEEILDDVKKNSSIVETEAYTSDGVWYLLRARPYAVTARISSGFILTFFDISSIKKAEERIAFQATLLENVQQAIIATDLNGRINYWNPFAVTLYQWERADVMGQMIQELVILETEQEKIEGIFAQLANGNPWKGNLDFRRKNGVPFTARVIDSPITDEDGAVIGIVWTSEEGAQAL